MSDQPKKGFFSNLKKDLPASIVVFLVALPLCLGIALASGAPLFSGVIAGIVGGILVGLLSGSPLGVSGPAAGLAIIVLNAISDLGSYEIFLVAVVLAGVIQLILGYLKAGVIGYYFPNSVIKGMLSGIGIIIFLKQIPHALGYDKDPEGDWGFFQVDGENTFSELVNSINYMSPGAVVISVVSLAILILWEQKFMKKLSFTNLLQGPLVAVVVSIILMMVFKGTEYFYISAEHLVNIPVAENFDEFLNLFTLPDFTAIGNKDVLITAVTIAVVASLETLLCVEATDKLDPYKRVTPTNRELKAQGVGNMLSGLVGGLPVTQVIVRSSANIQTGGVSKASAVFHGILLFISVLAIPTVLNMIPLASLAAILLVVGYKLAKPVLFKEMYKAGWGQFIPFVVTVVAIVFTDLLIGILLGLAVGVFQILYHNYKTPYHFSQNKFDTDEPVTIQLSEQMSFLNKASIQRTLNKIPDGAHIILDAQKTKSIHPDVLEIVHDFEQNAKTRDIDVELVGFKDAYHNSEKHFDRVIKDRRIRIRKKRDEVGE